MREDAECSFHIVRACDPGPSHGIGKLPKSLSLHLACAPNTGLRNLLNALVRILTLRLSAGIRPFCDLSQMPHYVLLLSVQSGLALRGFFVHQRDTDGKVLLSLLDATTADECCRNFSYPGSSTPPVFSLIPAGTTSYLSLLVAAMTSSRTSS